MTDLTDTLKWLSKYKPEQAKEAANFLTQNAICTPDGVYLVSTHDHDYQAHVDSDGVLYSVDGGYEECTWSNGSGQEECLRLSSDTPFLEAREKLIWGSYGKSGKEPLHYIRLKDMEDGHIEKVIWLIEDQPNKGPAIKWRREMMLQELEYRKQQLLED